MKALQIITFNKNRLKEQQMFCATEHTPFFQLLLYVSFFFAGILAFGVKESAIVNKIFTAVNIMVLLFVILSGVIMGNINNWHLNEASLLDQYKYGSLCLFILLHSIVSLNSALRAKHCFKATISQA